jgi:uncharacterized protein YjiK
LNDESKILPTLFFCIAIVLSCNTTVPVKVNKTGYDFKNPDQKLILPENLHEVSGITSIDSTTAACIQDENGILFLYDIVLGKVKEEFTFHIDGDYEGIARVQDTLYVLQSDGTLFEISDYTSQQSQLTEHSTGIPANNNEGLCYDANNNRLLIACKGKIGKGKEFKDKRVIYGFDLATKKLSDEPIFDFDLQTIKDFALLHELDIPERTKKKGKVTEPIIKFRTSAIAIHPYTNQLYVLSAADHLLFVFEMNGKLIHIEALNEEMFNKAEGIIFFENGDLFITNEGQDKKPTLLRFNFKK